MKNKRLGRGLEALIPQMDENESASRQHSLDEVEVKSIRENPLQPRQEFARAQLDELKRSIEQNGMIQPLTVRKSGSDYELIAGERRLRAVRELGYRTVPVYVMDVTSDDRMLELALVENIQRENLNPIELAKAYSQLQKEYGLTQEEVADKVGKDRATVTNIIRLLNLPDQIRKSLRDGEIGIGHAKPLLSLPTKSAQLKLWQKCVSNGWSVRTVEQEVRSRLGNEAGDNRPVKAKKPARLAHLEDTLRSVMGTRVRIVPSGKGGRVEIHYFSDDELDRVVEMIQNSKS
ncbi:ParB/RepB/Spo0J family partition protein [bacterium]|nr:ParB/RepB/Spo0J family partition protein [bacterium]